MTSYAVNNNGLFRVNNDANNSDSEDDIPDVTVNKITAFVTSPHGQMIIGFGIGVVMHVIYGPLTQKITQLCGLSGTAPDPFNGLGYVSKILLSPFISVIGPILEEKEFRGDLQGMIKEKLETFYVNRGCSNKVSNIAARVTAVFFSSIIFGLVHFSNALFIWCNPVLFVPQVIAATIMGFILGLAKEFTGDIYLPMGMHIGNNTLAMGAMLVTP